MSLLERAESLLPPQEINVARQHTLIWGLAESGRLDDAISRAARIAEACATAGDRVGELRSTAGRRDLADQHRPGPRAPGGARAGGGGAAVDQAGRRRGGSCRLGARGRLLRLLSAATSAPRSRRSRARWTTPGRRATSGTRPACARWRQRASGRGPPRSARRCGGWMTPRRGAPPISPSLRYRGRSCWPSSAASTRHGRC